MIIRKIKTLEDFYKDTVDQYHFNREELTVDSILDVMKKAVEGNKRIRETQLSVPIIPVTKDERITIG